MLLKNSLKKIKKSFGRYLSLVLIILLGVGFYTGIIVSIPNIRDIQMEYYNDKNAMDIKILSTLGFNDSDISLIKDTKDVAVAVGTYSVDTLVNDEVVRVHALEKDINNVLLIDGTLPTKKNECVADDAFYKVGEEDKWARSGYEEWINNSDIIMREIILSRNLKYYSGFSLFRYDYLFNDSMYTNNTLLEIENMKKVLK